MATSPTRIRPSDPAIKAYHAKLKEFADAGVTHEGATETAFGRLLADVAKSHGWLLIPKQGMKSKVTGKQIYPDGTFQDAFYLIRGYWEAKDTDDDLDTEVRNKIDDGYPLTNTIFEDTREAALYQGGKPTDAFDLSKPDRVADLLNAFFGYTEPDIKGFEQAVTEFSDRVPDLGRGLADILLKAHTENPAFQTAFDAFFKLCRATLNPNLRAEAVDEMLIQHLLTERLFRTIFAQSDFIRKNVIAAEVEKVVDALTGTSFSRDAFLKTLDRFYTAIELAAGTIDDFRDKQHFLNTVYERFFQGYSVKVADTHGIVYTPQAIVDFMCASVEEVLKTEFGQALGGPHVRVLDPCTGTGNFVVNLIRRVPGKDLDELYKKRLFANEVMLLPYYIAALNVEHAYYERTGRYEPFEGLCFVDTLDLVFERQRSLFSERNADRIERQQASEITVIIGNPPYNVGQINENDNNKNRKYEVIDQAIRQTYAKDSNATLSTKLYDPYVKFFRWATDRLKGRDGVVCFVTNNSFVDQIAFDGMRKHLLKDFTRIYHLHLEGNVRENPKLSGGTYNVFGIQVGVGITIAVKSAKHKDRRLLFHRVDKNLRRAAKCALLDKWKSMAGVAWEELAPPNAQYTWLAVKNADVFQALIPLGTKAAKASDKPNPKTLFKTFSLGVSTNRDAVVYDFRRDRLAERVEKFIERYNAEVDRYKRVGAKMRPEEFFVSTDIKWSRNLKRFCVRGVSLTYIPDAIRTSLYRPFTKKLLYFAEIATDEAGQFFRFSPTAECETENRILVVSDIGYRAKTTSALCCRHLPDLHLCASTDGHQCFPFYVYDEDGSNRRENITDWALKQFRGRYSDRKMTKWDVFHYVYGLLHHPGYRVKYAGNLRKSLPRVPFAPDFRAFATAGKQLAELHIGYEEVEPYPLKFVETPGMPLNYAIEKMMLLGQDSIRLWVNRSLSLEGIPLEVLQYRLGNRSALDWVIDQYQVAEDKRSGAKSNPNRSDDPRYIVDLVGRVVAVSLRTVELVAALPEAFESGEGDAPVQTV